MKKSTAKLLFLSEVTQITSGYPFRGSVDALPDGSIPVVQARNVNNDTAQIDWQATKKIAAEVKKTSDWLQDGDILLATRGGYNSAILVEAPPKKALCSTLYFIIRMTQPGVTPAYLAWWLNQRPAQQHFKNNATGSHILNVTRRAVEDTPLVIPSIQEQQAIVALVTLAKTEKHVLSNLIEARQQQLDAIATALNNRSRTQ